MKITLLGSGTPTPSLTRMGTGLLLEIGADVILVDHGPGAYHRLLETGRKPVDVTHLFFTHLHYDHCVDYPRLLLTRWDQGAGRVPELQVFGPAPIGAMTERLFGEDGAFDPDLTARTNHPLSVDVYRARGGTPPRLRPQPVVRELAAGEVVDGEGWRVRVAEVVHAQPYLTCYAYRFDTPEGSFVYSGDTGPTPALDELAKGADVLMHMCHYISGTELSADFAATCGGHREVARAAANAGVRTLVMTHITEQMDRPGVPERLVREMGEIFSGNIIFGRDLMTIPLGDPTPAKLD